MNNLPAPFPSGKKEPTLPISFEQRPQLSSDHLTSPLMDIWRIIYLRRWLITAIMVAAIGMALLLYNVLPETYQARSRVQIDRAPEASTDLEGEIGGNATYNWEFYETQYELLKSRRLAMKVVDALSLDENAAFVGVENSGDGEAAESRRRAVAIGKVMGGTTVSPIPNSSIVDITYTGEDPAIAADIANALADEYVDMDLEQRYQAAQNVRTFLAERLEEARGKLEASEREAAAYARGKGLVSTQTGAEDDGSGSIRAGTLRNLNNELASATARRIAAEAELRSNRGGQASSTALSDGAVSDIRTQRATISAELSKLESDFGPEYPRVRALRSQLAELDRTLARERSSIGSSVTSRLRDAYDQALREETALRQRVANAKGELLNEQQQEIGLNIIRRDIDQQRELYDGLLERYKIVGVAGASSANRISIVDRAEVPGGPASPNLFLLLTGFLIAGVLASAALVFVLDQMRRSRLTPADISGKLGVPLIGQTPLIGGPGKKDSPEALGARNALAESYFSALTTMRFMSEHGMPKSMLVTSSKQYEGKTTTTMALANDLASTGANVLLVDGDLRSPSIHKYAGQPLDRGLTDYLVGRASLDELVFHREGEKLSFLFTGTPPMDPARLLSTDRFTQLLTDAAEMFDYVLVDGPPVLGLADACLLARQCAGTVFVVESNKTPAPMARNALQRLMDVNARVIGTLITKFDAQRDTYGYGYGYGYGETYGYGDETRAALGTDEPADADGR